MAHDIEGNKAFYVSQPAWHGLGTVLTEAPSIEEAWKLAYPHSLIECEIEAVITDDQGNRHTMPIESRKAIFRDDGIFIGDVGKRYQLEQPAEVMISAFDPLMKSGLVSLEAGGSLRGGTRMWGLAKINYSDLEVVKGDALKAYMLVATGFDGSLQRTQKLCETRAVCWNTVSAALAEENELSFTIKHTRNMEARVTDATNAIHTALKAHTRSVEAYRSLAKKKTSDEKMHAYVRNVIAPEIKVEDYSPQMTTKVNLVIDLIDNQRGLELVPAIRGTAWQAYNAVTEYLTHHASRSADTRVNNQWFDGNTQALNRRALDMALAM